MVDFFSKIFRKKQGLKEKKEPVEIFVQHQAVGSSGTEIYSGYLQEEYLDDLIGPDRAIEFDKMRRGDYSVRMCLSAVKNPIKGACWEIEATEDTQEAKKDADLIRHILFNGMDRPWKKFIEEATTLVDFGYSLFEKIHTVKIAHPEFGSYIGIKSFAWRSPKTIERWNIDRETEKLVSISQTAYGDAGKSVNIPAQNIILFNLMQEGLNFEGISLLRGAYGPWFRKNLYLKLNVAGIEKFAIPTPVASIPDGLQGSTQYANLINVLDSYTSHQKNYITKPVGWELNLVTNQGFDPGKVEISIDNEDKRMAMAFLANFLLLGMNSVGSYALSNDLSDFFLSALDFVAEEISEKINLEIIPELIKLNRGERAKYPRLKFSGISDKAGKELAEIYSILAQSKIIIPDDNLEDHARLRFKMPPKSEKGQRLKQEPIGFGEKKNKRESILAKNFSRAGIRF